MATKRDPGPDQLSLWAFSRGDAAYKRLRAAFRAECEARDAKCEGWPGACGRKINYTAPPQSRWAWELCHAKSVRRYPWLAMSLENMRAGHSGCNRRAHRP
jgi:hypothetical protein